MLSRSIDESPPEWSVRVMTLYFNEIQHDVYETVPFSKLRRVLALMYPAVQRAHKTRGLIEVDVTDARRLLREYRARTGEALSFTAFIITCLAHAVDENKALNTCHKGGKHLAQFSDVDIAMPIERNLQGHKQPIVYIVRAANTKSFREIHQEIRAAQVAMVETTWEGFQAERWLMLLPMIVLRIGWDIFWWARGRYPRLQKRYGGTVGLTTVGMFSKGGGWAIPFDYHTLDVALGGIAKKPGVVAGEIAVREYLYVTLSFDHDIIDGAPAARFVSRLREIIESGYDLTDLQAAEYR
jgi:pyruvate/2-oxoglutarate dehydrogenase complex dihydrolipoamide acyltransferase (E2) component